MEMLRALNVFVALTLITGVIYPLLVSGLGAVLFPRQATGSLLSVQGRVVGSELLGQRFQGQSYFWGRPSATAPFPYNAAAGAGTNLASSNPILHEQVQNATERIIAAHDGKFPVPIDLVTSSASGLDPHISIAAAEYQIARVAKARKLSVQQVEKLIRTQTADRFLGILGERRVNVLMLNNSLDAMVQR